MRLVLIEDHEALGEGLELLLDREGWQVVGTAGTATEGRDLIERLAPDVALVDIRLGDESGIDLAREREIMDLLAHGLTGEDVAERLVLSSETVTTHIRNAMGKLEANTRVHAVAIALREGYISPPENS